MIDESREENKDLTAHNLVKLASGLIVVLLCASTSLLSLEWSWSKFQCWQQIHNSYPPDKDWLAIGRKEGRGGIERRSTEYG
jgi:hypothetical protein